jgi:6-bladed beta-propeller protein
VAASSGPVSRFGHSWSGTCRNSSLPHGPKRAPARFVGLALPWATNGPALRDTLVRAITHTSTSGAPWLGTGHASVAVRVGMMRAVGLAIAITGCVPDGDLESASRWRDVTDSMSVRTVVPAATVCHDCISLTSTAVLGDDSGEGYVEVTLDATRDHRGRYWIAQRDGFKVFDAEGRYERQVGIRGQGPLEFQVPGDLFVDADGYVHLFDFGTVRETVVDEDMRLTHERPLPGLVQNVWPMPDGYVANVQVPTEESSAKPLHVVEDGAIVASFGALETPGSGAVSRHVTMDQQGWIFSSRMFEYEILAWSPAGRRLAGFQRPGLFEPLPRIPPGERRVSRPVYARLEAIHVDDQDRLWVSILIAKASLEGLPPMGLDDFRTVLEVIDLNSALVIASAEIDDPIVGFFGAKTVWGYTYTPVGEPRLAVWDIKSSGVLGGGN